MSFARALDGSRIYYRVDTIVPAWEKAPRGTVFMHHGVALNGDAWTEWVPVILQAGFRVIRIDMRGFGRSDRVSSDYRWTFDNFLDDIGSVADEVGVERYHFIGESLGGLIGLANALERSERVLSLGLLSTPFDGKRIGRAIDGWRAIIAEGGMEGWADTLMQQRFSPSFNNAALLEWVHGLQRECDPNAVLGQAEFIRRQDFSDRLAAIDVPALIMAPDQSPFVDASLADDLNRHLRNSEIRWYPGERHSLLLSRAKACAAAWVEFVSRRCQP